MKNGITKDQVIAILAAGLLYFLSTFISDIRAAMNTVGENTVVLAEHKMKIGDIEKIRGSIDAIRVDMGSIKGVVNELKAQQCFFKRNH